MPLYLFGRVAEDRWELLDLTCDPCPASAWVDRIRDNEQLAGCPWAIVIVAEPGAVALSELLAHWGMTPGCGANADRVMYEFITLARGRRAAGDGVRWMASPSGTAVLAENRLREWEAGAAAEAARRRPWWRFWG